MEIGDSRAWLLKTHGAWLDEPSTPSPVVRLLPRFDIYLLGYQNRTLMVPHQYAKRVNAGGGILHPTLLVDGRVVATWKSQRKKDSINLTVEPFDRLSPEIYPLLEAEAADITRFLGMRTELNVE